jgi:hypothetical protein
MLHQVDDRQVKIFSLPKEVTPLNVDISNTTGPIHTGFVASEGQN